MRFSVVKKRKLSAMPFICLLVAIVLMYVFWLIEANLKPTLLAFAEAKATALATQAINSVIDEKISRAVNPQSLVSVTLDNRGRVVLIQPNTMAFNKLAADTTIAVQDRLKEIPAEKIYIPIGQVFGSQLLASLGPQITVTVIPVGTVQVKVIDKFEQAGINQTRHMIYLLATTQVRIVVPLVSKSVVVNTQVPVSEYVVVGDVPGTYVQIPFPLANELPSGGSEKNSNE